MVHDPNGDQPPADATRRMPAVPDPDATRLNRPVGDDATRVTPPGPNDATRVTPAGPNDATRVNRPLGNDATRIGAPLDAEPGPAHWTARASVPPAGAYPASDAPQDWDERPEEDPYGGRSWFTPVIAGLVGLVLLAAVGFGVYLIYRNVNGGSQPAPSASVPVASSAPAPTSAPPTTQSPTPSPTPSASPSQVDQVTIPPVRGDTEQSATAQLNDLGLVVVVQRRVDPAIRPGRVIDTDPPAGETLPDGGTITLIVAAAPASPSASPSPAQS